MEITEYLERMKFDLNEHHKPVVILKVLVQQSIKHLSLARVQ